MATVLALGVAFAALAALGVVIADYAATLSYPPWVGPLAGLAKFGLLAALALALLRVEGVRPTDLGLSRSLLKPAVVTVAGVWLALNVLAAGLASATGNPWGLGVLVDLPVRWAGIPAPRVTSLVFGFLAVALVEEFVFRGYLQTKVVSMLGDGSRFRVGLGVVTAGLVFGAMHAPGAIVAGASPRGVLGTVLFLSLSGVAFGVLYELTHNVYLVALLHVLGNNWPLVGDLWALSGAALVAALVGVATIYAAGTVAYRYWMWDVPGGAAGDGEATTA